MADPLLQSNPNPNLTTPFSQRQVPSAPSQATLGTPPAPGQQFGSQAARMFRKKTKGLGNTRGSVGPTIGPKGARPFLQDPVAGQWLPTPGSEPKDNEPFGFTSNVRPKPAVFTPSAQT